MSEPLALVIGEATAARNEVVEALAGRDEIVVESIAPGEEFAGDGPGAVFAVGQEGLLSLARSSAASEAPVFPIAIDGDRYGIPAATVAAAADACATGDFETVAHPVLRVDVAGDTAGRSIADVTLLTTEPARISEYAVGTPDGWLDTVRADGIVTATPVGSTGYARAAGGPQLAPGTGLVTVPISPYTMHAHPWVLRPPISLSVERDEAEVSLRLDGEIVRPVPTGERLTVRVGHELQFVRPPTVEG
ncbi:NAD(+)/NADH kinase [Halobellus marinus]|uniref:NAD(+)/NADH kinase n=1 Tax=Halobellus TaxID=1073986 RepID=UPI0028A88070|nr:NAD(+)/NADH kinase [Halobellus sp. DFY28]